MRDGSIYLKKGKNNYIIPLNKCQPDLLNEVGGKAVGLYKLISTGVDVPDGYCLTVSALKDTLKYNKFELQEIISTLGGLDSKELHISMLDEISKKMEEIFLNLEIDEKLNHELMKVYEHLVVNQGKPLVVRSSAVLEDTKNLSFAGQHSTFIGVVDFKDLIESIKRVWASYYSARALSYRIKSGLDNVPKIAVIIQKLINAVKSGVIFTLDPITSDRSKIVIESVWGLGEGLVSGEVTPDQYKIDKVTFEIEQKIIRPKEYIYMYDITSRKVKKVYADDIGKTSSLTDEEILELANKAKLIEKSLKEPQDIEWACEEENQKVFYFLQSRPVTTIKTSIDTIEYTKMDTISSITHAISKVYKIEL